MQRPNLATLLHNFTTQMQEKVGGDQGLAPLSRDRDRDRQTDKQTHHHLPTNIQAHIHAHTRPDEFAKPIILDNF